MKNKICRKAEREKNGDFRLQVCSSNCSVRYSQRRNWWGQTSWRGVSDLWWRVETTWNTVTLLARHPVCLTLTLTHWAPQRLDIKPQVQWNLSSTIIIRSEPLVYSDPVSANFPFWFTRPGVYVTCKTQDTLSKLKPPIAVADIILRQTLTSPSDSTYVTSDRNLARAVASRSQTRDNYWVTVLRWSQNLLQ